MTPFGFMLWNVITSRSTRWKPSTTHAYTAPEMCAVSRFIPDDTLTRSLELDSLTKTKLKTNCFLSQMLRSRKKKNLQVEEIFPVAKSYNDFPQHIRRVGLVNDFP